MSPAARGLVPGLFLAVAVAFAVLAVNHHWLLPSLDETGVRYLTLAPQLAAGAAPAVPIASWDAEAGTSGLAGRGALMPWIMAGLVAGGARPHVAALWVLAGAAALTVLALAWTTGGASGVAGAALTGVLVALAPFTLDASTAVAPAILLGALAAWLVGAMTYQPRWHALHGTLGALAWLAHPAGVGAVAAAMVWPAAGRAGARGAWGARALLAAAPAAVLLAVGARWPLLAPPTGAPSLPALGQALHALLLDAAPFARAWWSVPAGGVLLAGLGILVVVEARTTPAPPPSPHWSDPAAADLLALRFRRAAGLVALASVVGSAWGGPDASEPLPAALLLVALAGAAAVRWARRMRGAAGWAPLLVLVLWGAGAALASRRGIVLLRTEGRGLTARVWVASPVIRWIDNRSRPYERIYATDPALVLVQTGRAARSLPSGDADVDAFARRFAAHPGALVLTGADDTDARAGSLSELLGLSEAVHAAEGRVLVPSGAAP